MKFMLVPSLERAALTPISVTLWKIWWSTQRTRDPSYVAEDSFDTNDWMTQPNIDWKKGRNQVRESVQKLIIPENLKQKVSKFADAVGDQIKNWLQFYVHYWGIVDKVPESFVWTWTSVGTIDQRKTAYLLVCDDAIDISCRLKLACIYCMEEHIVPLLNQIDEEKVSNIINLDSASADSRASITQAGAMDQFISGLRNYLLAKHRHQNSIDYHTDEGYPPGFSPIELFTYSLEKSGFCPSAKFFYLEILKQQNNKTIVPIINRALKVYYDDDLCYYDLQYAEILCFILNHMNEHQQIQVLRSAPVVVFGVLLQWPWHEVFIKAYQLVGHLLSVEDFHYILIDVMTEMTSNCWRYGCERIFIHMWQNASSEYREYVYTYDYDEISDRFVSLCEHENWYACNLLLEGVPENTKGHWVSSSFFYLSKYFTSLIFEGKWDKIGSFLTICRLSNQEIVIFRDEIIKHLHSPPHTEETVKMLNNIVDSFITANKKRCIENSKNEPKRLCCRILKRVV